MATKIYTLCCPITEEVKYIGITRQDLNLRFNEHIYRGRRVGSKNKRESWIKSLLNKNLYPNIDIIDIVYDCDSLFFESFYIDLFKSWGFNLKNSMMIKKSNIDKKGSSLKGRNISNEHKNRISEGLNRFYSKNISKNKGKSMSIDCINKIKKTSRLNTLNKYKLNSESVIDIKNKFNEFNGPLYKYAKLIGYPYSFIYNIIVNKKFDNINE